MTKEYDDTEARQYISARDMWLQTNEARVRLANADMRECMRIAQEFEQLWRETSPRPESSYDVLGWE